MPFSNQPANTTGVNNTATGNTQNPQNGATATGVPRSGRLFFHPGVIDAGAPITPQVVSLSGDAAVPAPATPYGPFK